MTNSKVFFWLVALARNSHMVGIVKASRNPCKLWHAARTEECGNFHQSLLPDTLDRRVMQRFLPRTSAKEVSPVERLAQ